jgi:hypothetical protein
MSSGQIAVLVIAVIVFIMCVASCGLFGIVVFWILICLVFAILKLFHEH